MDDYEKLLQITSNKLKISDDFLKQTKAIKKMVDDGEFDDIDLGFEKREEFIDSVNLLDEQFLSLFSKLKKTPDFEDKIKNYSSLSVYIEKIKQNFKDASEIDEQMMPVINEELKLVKAKIKESKEKTKVSSKYAEDSIQKITKENYGIFIDEKS